MTELEIVEKGSADLVGNILKIDGKYVSTIHHNLDIQYLEHEKRCYVFYKKSHVISRVEESEFVDMVKRHTLLDNAKIMKVEMLPINLNFREQHFHLN